MKMFNEIMRFAKMGSGNTVMTVMVIMMMMVMRVLLIASSVAMMGWEREREEQPGRYLHLMRCDGVK